MTGPKRYPAGLGVRGYEPYVGDDHTALLVWEAEQDALRAPIPHCTCFTAEGEYVPGCFMHPEETSEAS